MKIITQCFCRAIGRTISSAAVSITELMHLIVRARQTGRRRPQKWVSSPCGGVCVCIYMCTYDYLCATCDCEEVCWKGFPLCNDFCCKWKSTGACHTTIPVLQSPKLQVTGTPVNISKCRKSPTGDKGFFTVYRNDTYNASVMPQRVKLCL